jgi:hypothetical protein
LFLSFFWCYHWGMVRSLSIISVLFALCPFTLPGAGGTLAQNSGPAARMYLGDAASVAVYSHAGAQAGSVLDLYVQGNERSLLSLTPIVIEGNDVSAPVQSVSAGIVSQNEAVFSFEEGAEFVRFSHGRSANASVSLAYIQDGVYVWQMALSNASASTRSFQLGLVMHTGSVDRTASFNANDAQLLMLVANQALALGAVGAHPLAYASALRGAPLALFPESERPGAFSFTAQISLEAFSQATVSFVLAFDRTVGDAARKCSDRMRLAASGALEERRRALWRDWLSAGRAPDLSDAALRQSLFRALRSLDAALHHKALTPADAEALLDCAEAMRAFGRDAAASQYMAMVSAFLAERRQTLAAFAESTDGRETLMRYVSLAARLTITSGRLAGDLELVRLALNALASAAPGREGTSPAGAALSSGAGRQATHIPSEAVRLAASFSDGALLARLSRDERNAAQFESNALIFQERQNRLYSESAVAWTDALGVPDMRVFTTGTYFKGGDVRFVRQYRAMRPFASALPPRERALFLCAAAQSFDREYFQSALEANTQALAEFNPTQAMAIWIKVLGDGVLYACLDERTPYSDYRLESLFRILLEIRHTSRHAAASFIFRDLRARIRDKLDRPRERDDAFIGSLVLEYGRLRTELDRYALAAPLERSLTLARLDQIERIILAMVFSRQGQYPRVTCVAGDNGLRVSIPENALLGALPPGWRVGASELRGGVKEILLLSPAARNAAAPEYVAVEHRVHIGGQEQRWFDSLLLSHPNPVVPYIIPHGALHGKFVLHNRGWRPMDIMSVQSTHPLIKEEMPFRLGAQGAIILDMDMVPDLQPQPMRLLVTISENGTVHRVEPNLNQLSRQIPFHSRWDRLPSGDALDLDALSAGQGGQGSGSEFSFPQAGMSLAKTFDTPDVSGNRVFGVRAGSSPWTLSFAGRTLSPVLQYGWYWYDLGPEKNPRLTLSFPNYEALILFAESAKRLAIGQER